MFNLESNIHSWIDLVREKGNLTDSDLLELENHLRDEVDDLINRGLAKDEAFLISIKRLGNISEFSNEYSKLNSEQLWKHLMHDPTKHKHHGQLFLVILFSILAGTLFKLPGLFSDSFNDLFYFKHLSLFILPFVALFFVIKHKLNWLFSTSILGIFVLSAFLINIYPSYDPNNTEVLTAIHLPIFLWLITGVTYMGTKWNDSKERMNFIRFTGESFIYGVLISCGIIVLCMFTFLIFSAIGIDLNNFVTNYLLIYGMCSAVMITLYLVESKRSIVENFAPILAKIFSPLFLIIMISFLLAMLFTGKSPLVDRNYLIGFDLMLVLVLGLVLYVISARNIHARKNTFDYINLALIMTALMIDLVALTAIVFRLSQFGITPNKVAALGENIVLLANLGILSWQYIRYLTNKIEFSVIEKTQTSYLTIYAVWLAIVAFIFPLLFGFN